MQLPVWVGHLVQQEPRTQRQTNPSSRETKNMQPEFLFQTFFPSILTLINAINLNIPPFLDHSIHSEHWIQVACQILMLWPLLQWQWHSWDVWSRRRNSWSVWCSASQELEMGMLRIQFGWWNLWRTWHIDNKVNGGYFRSKRGSWKRNLKWFYEWCMIWQDANALLELLKDQKIVEGCQSPWTKEAQ